MTFLRAVSLAVFMFFAPSTFADAPPPSAAEVGASSVCDVKEAQGETKWKLYRVPSSVSGFEQQLTWVMKAASPIVQAELGPMLREVEIDLYEWIQSARPAEVSCAAAQTLKGAERREKENADGDLQVVAKRGYKAYKAKFTELMEARVDCIKRYAKTRHIIANAYVHIDVGGDGRNSDAINVNIGAVTSTDPPLPIPNLLPGDPGTIPLPNRFAVKVTVRASGFVPAADGVPGTAVEVARIIRRGATVKFINDLGADAAAESEKRCAALVAAIKERYSKFSEKYVHTNGDVTIMSLSRSL